MATMLPWTSIEIGDLEIFAPSLPSLLVHTSYVDGDPESSVTYFWQDPATGLIKHEVLFLKPVGFEEALDWAQAHAASENIERIHVRHARTSNNRKKPAKKARSGAKAGRPKRTAMKKTRGKKKARMTGRRAAT